jgi:ATP-dependent DNA ligase
MLRFPFVPCIPTKAAKVPDRPEWIHEIKHDGYRLIVQRDGKRVRLWTRNGHDWSDRFPSMRKASLARLLARRVDGVFPSDFEQGEIGPDLFRHACLMGLEGMVSKHRESAYRGGRFRQ